MCLFIHQQDKVKTDAVGSGATQTHIEPSFVIECELNTPTNVNQVPKNKLKTLYFNKVNSETGHVRPSDR